MTLLVWLSIALLLIFLVLFITWVWREPRVGTGSIRTAFLGATLVFFALFLVFTWNSLASIPRSTHEERMTASVVAGKLAWQKYLCIDCHTILGNGAYYAPDLTKAWSRFLDRAGGNEAAARSSMIAFLQHPPNATIDRRGMPNMKIGTEEANNLVDFLKWTSEIDTNGWPPGPRRAALVPAPARTPPPSDLAGKKLFASSGCISCHSIGGGPVVGPDLAGAAAKYDRATLIQWMRNSNVVYRARGTTPVNRGFPQMPALGLSDADAGAIADYLIAVGRS